ncbi:MAG: M23 family metallopeptidase [Gammaproteobacteria bacterium]|nr:M23 family metallopeptidase [Gammaproteobacteria bacterium]
MMMTEQTSLGVIDFVEALQAVSQSIEDRSEKFTAMESMLLDSNIQSQILPEGSPVTGGWTSSLFGWRTDPISGKKGFHEGIDFAGRTGSNVSSVAAGIVTWSGKDSGFGRMVEISHGNGYVTRYAHNKKNLVAVGDKVEKGQKIAVMGSSGRSTGPHVHFEVVHNGRHVNPRKFVSIN